MVDAFDAGTETGVAVTSMPAADVVVVAPGTNPPPLVLLIPGGEHPASKISSVSRLTATVINLGDLIVTSNICSDNDQIAAGVVAISLAWQDITCTKKVSPAAAAGVMNSTTTAPALFVVVIMVELGFARTLAQGTTEPTGCNAIAPLVNISTQILSMGRLLSFKTVKVSGV